MKRRTLTLVIALALAGTLVFPSAATPLFAGPTDDIGSDLSLAPSSEYAALDEDGELTVDISASNPSVEGGGVNRGAVTSFADVFRIRYGGSQYARVWLEHDAEAVTFTVDGRPVDAAADNVTLAPNESVAVSLTVDTTTAADGSVDDITIRSRVAEPETATDRDRDGFATQSVAPTADSRRFTVLGADPGHPVAFDASRLELDRVDRETLTFDSISMTSPNRSFSVTAGTAGTEGTRSLVDATGAEPLGAVRTNVSSGTVSAATMRFSVSESYFDRRRVDPENLVIYRHDGDLSRLPVTMTGERDGRITFAAETPGFSTFVVAVDRPRLRLASAGLDATTVAPGEPVTVSASVSNAGTLAGERSVTVAVDDAVVAERTVTVSPGSTETVTVPVTRSAPGEYRVTVDGTDAGSFRVTAPATATPSPDGADPTASPDRSTQSPIAEPSGFGLRSLLGLLVLLVIVGATLALFRRAPRP